ncbi:MAG: metalloregulator ArsR/SmtB family transcription factor [Pseudomonadota bacterium]
MEITDSHTTRHARALAALGHDARLAIFRLLVRAGEPGLTVGQISEHLGFAASTQAHHLRTLSQAGLITQQKNGREVINRADFDAMRALTAFLTEECCAGFVAADTAPEVAVRDRLDTAR